LPPFDCEGCQPAASTVAAVQALPGLPPFDCEGCPPAASTVAAVQALPGLPPFDCEGCPPATMKHSVSMLAMRNSVRPQFADRARSGMVAA